MKVRITEYSDRSDRKTVKLWVSAGRLTRTGYWAYREQEHWGDKPCGREHCGEGATRDVAKSVLLTAIAEHDTYVEYKPNENTDWQDVPRDDLIEFIDYLSE